MEGELSFQRYLASKRTVDDRALNTGVWKALEERLLAVEGRPLLEVLELGAGVGTMFQRMVEWGLLDRARYTLVDEEADNIVEARRLLIGWAAQQGLTMRDEVEGFSLFQGASQFVLQPVVEEMSAFLARYAKRRWDLLVMHAVLDLLDVPAVLPAFKSALRPGGLMYLTLNFDGLTSFEPPVDPELDERIINIYHRTMDERITAGKKSGDSRTGRHLFTWLRQAGLHIIEAGSSDWVVYPRDRRYPVDEAYFLYFILHFFAESLGKRPEIGQAELMKWLEIRKAQIQRGELVFTAHQFDFLVQSA